MAARAEAALLQSLSSSFSQLQLPCYYANGREAPVLVKPRQATKNEAEQRFVMTQQPLTSGAAEERRHGQKGHNHIDFNCSAHVVIEVRKPSRAKPSRPPWRLFFFCFALVSLNIRTSTSQKGLTRQGNAFFVFAFSCFIRERRRASRLLSRLAVCFRATHASLSSWTGQWQDAAEAAEGAQH